MKKVFVIDNYDSFTYNLVQYLTELNCKVLLKRNDQFKLNEIENFEYVSKIADFTLRTETASILGVSLLM